MLRSDSMRGSMPNMWQFFSYFRADVRQERTLIATGLVALIAQTVMRLLEPWPLKYVIDRIIDRDPTAATIVAVVGAINVNTLLVVCAIALIIVTALRSTLGYRSKVNFALAGNRIVTRIRSQVFRHLQLLPLDFHYRERGGDLVSRLVGDVGMIKEVAVNAFMPLVASILVLAGMLAIMFVLDVQMTLIILFMGPLLWMMTARRSRNISRIAKKNRRREGAIAATAAESLTAIKTVQSLSIGDRFLGIFSTENNASLKQGAKVARMTAGLERSVDLLIAAGSAFALWYGARQVIAQTLTPGELLVFLFYMKRGFRPMRDYAKYSARLGKASAAAERVIQILSEVPTKNATAEGVAAEALSGHIRFENVTYTYPNGGVGLRNANFTIQPGETVIIMGQSGSGKSTLLNLLLNLHSPQRGMIFADGVNIEAFSTESYRSQFNVVLQDGLLFTGSIRENIALLRPDASDDDVIAAAKLAHCHEFICKLSDGYDAPLGERGTSLSLGQRQRLAIARAAIRYSPVLVLDEPTAGLDTDNEHAVCDSIAVMAQDRTTIWVTHKMPDNVFVDRVFIVQDGVVHEQQHHAAMLDGLAS